MSEEKVEKERKFIDRSFLSLSRFRDQCENETYRLNCTFFRPEDCRRNREDGGISAIIIVDSILLQKNESQLDHAQASNDLRLALSVTDLQEKVKMLLDPSPVMTRGNALGELCSEPPSRQEREKDKSRWKEKVVKYW